ncbi:Sec-independent protein translocase protein TatB [Jiella sp. M17.18]|uniref:Sec-independent protein translocase protein TatB n=1 Tax=Jiella sp. M17.18 TaxID=3234247 RepID=UPI0034DDF8EE
MFDIGWSELLVIAVVLVVVVGPKDLPGMLRTFGRTTKQLRAMAGEFRRQFDEALQEAELDDVRSSVDEIRNLDPRRTVRDAMNPMRAIGDEIRSSLAAAAKAPEPRIPANTDTLTTGEAKVAEASEPAAAEMPAVANGAEAPAGPNAEDKAAPVADSEPAPAEVATSDASLGQKREGVA